MKERDNEIFIGICSTVNYNNYNTDKGEIRSDYQSSKEYLLRLSMSKHGITENDLRDISIVKSKIRISNIDNILV